jgi:hypothetical protein
MTHSRFITKFSNLAPACAAAVAALVALPTQVHAGEKADCRVAAVEAKKEGDGSIPSNLAFMKDELESSAFAAFKGFKLLDSKTMAVEVGRPPARTAIRPKHTIKLELLSADKRLKLHANIAGASPLVDLDYNIEDRGLMLFPVPRGEDAIIFAIQCAKKSG